VNKIREGIGDKIASFINGLAMFISGIVIAFVYGWKMSLVILAVSPLMIVCGLIMTMVSTLSNLSVTLTLGAMEMLLLSSWSLFHPLSFCTSVKSQNHTFHFDIPVRHLSYGVNFPTHSPCFLCPTLLPFIFMLEPWSCYQPISWRLPFSFSPSLWSTSVSLPYWSQHSHCLSWSLW